MAEEDKASRTRKEPIPDTPIKRGSKRKRNPLAKALNTEALARRWRYLWDRSKKERYPLFFRLLACRHCSDPLGAHTKVASTAPLRLVCASCEWGYRTNREHINGGHHEFEPEIPLRIINRRGREVEKSYEYRGRTYCNTERKVLPDAIIRTTGFYADGKKVKTPEGGDEE